MTVSQRRNAWEVQSDSAIIAAPADGSSLIFWESHVCGDNYTCNGSWNESRKPEKVSKRFVVYTNLAGGLLSYQSPRQDWLKAVSGRARWNSEERSPVPAR